MMCSVLLAVLIGSAAAAQGGQPQHAASGGEKPEEWGMALAEMSAADIERRGRIVYLRCRSCHTLEPGGAHRIGPNLAGIVGAPAAAREGFTYSDALQSADLKWDYETLDAWLEAPSKLVPGNIMVFAGLGDPGDRAAVVAYMEAASAHP